MCNQTYVQVLTTQVGKTPHASKLNHKLNIRAPIRSRTPTFIKSAQFSPSQARKTRKIAWLILSANSLIYKSPASSLKNLCLHHLTHSKPLARARNKRSMRLHQFLLFSDRPRNNVAHRKIFRKTKPTKSNLLKLPISSSNRRAPLGRHPL